MKTLLVGILLVAFCLVCQAVQVKEGDFTFSLESVKKLKDLMDVSTVRSVNPRLMGTSGNVLCTNPDLPQEFMPLCKTKKATLSLSRLALVAYNSDVCEICAFAACTGC